MGFPGGSVVKNLPLANAGGMSSIPGSGQRSLGGYSPRGHKESYMTKQLKNNNISSIVYMLNKLLNFNLFHNSCKVCVISILK